jgi:cell fate regulator YaaT (PSP1 superfamily)
MIKVIGVQFNSAVRIYDFKAGVSKPSLNDWVLVDTAQGKEIGRVAYLSKEINPANEDDVKEILRVADEKDIERYKRMVEAGEEYYELFRKVALESGLNLKPVRTELSFDGEKVVCYFTADARVDFRDIIRDLSREWKKGVMMRQIGPRDEAKLLGGYGICGQPVCCKRFLTKTESVTMDMAREQYENNVNASKVTGVCGRLMCCLAYEAGERPAPRKKR